MVITVYKNKDNIPPNMEYVELNDVFFNQNTAAKLDNYAKEMIKQIDEAKLLSKYKIESKFNGTTLDVLYSLDSGSVYSDYAVISFNMDAVKVSDSQGVRIIDDYEELREWWENEK